MVQLGDVSLDFDVCWGGFYAAEEETGDGYGIFRLLDFNIEAYHAALYQETFDEIPTLEEAQALSPCISHVPIDARQLVRFPTFLVGAKPLVVDDFDGYSAYLGADLENQKELVDRLVGFSQQEPVQLHLAITDGELSITERS